MVSQSYLARLAAICAVVNAAPLNINLGAYSPALVVGDGAIGFEGAAAGGVESIINTLQGAAASGAGNAGRAAEVAAPAVPQAGAQPVVQPVPQAAGEVAAASVPASQGLGMGSKAVNTGILNEKAFLPAPGAAKALDRRQEIVDDDEPVVLDSDDDDGALDRRQEVVDDDEPVVLDSDDDEDATTLTRRQEIVDDDEPVVLDSDDDDDSAAAAPIQKRQNAGFQASLAFAEGALTKGPKIQLGTGVNGAGIGILVENNRGAAA